MISEQVSFLPADFTPEGRYRVAYKTFEIGIYDDEIDEENQSFPLLLQPAPGLAVNVVLESDPRPLVTIVDDDPPPSVTVSDGGVATEGEDAEFTIRLSAESERAVTVWYSTTGEGTAGAADYEAAGGTIRFEPRVPRHSRNGQSVPGETEKTFTVTTTDDAIAEANEFLTVEVAIPPEGAGAAVLGSPVRGEARILDNDQPLSAPRGLTAFADNGAVTLHWQPPAADGGYGIGHYERRLRRGDRSDWTAWFTVPGGSGADSVKITGLTNDTAVEFEVRAVNTAPVAVQGPAASVSATPAATPPALSSATVNGSGLALVYGSLLKTDATANNAAFTLHTTVGTAPTVTGVSVSGASVNLDLSGPVSAAATVTLDYSSPGSSGIRTVEGVAAADFTGQQVDNATTPTVVTTAISSTPDAAYGYYVEGDTIAVKLTFDTAVAVDLAPADDVAPAVDISLGGSVQPAVYASGSGSTELVFEYSVVYSDYDADGVSVPAGSVALHGGAIRRDGTDTAAALTHAAVADHADHTVIGRPFVSGRAFVSQPHTGGVYHRNELIEARLTFNELVDVSGRPRVRILIANSGAYGDLVKAYYLRGSGTDTIVFGYRVRGSDRDNNGIHISANTLGEGSITRSGTATRVNWRFSRHAGGWGQRVHGSQPGVPLAPVLTGASAARSVWLSWTAPNDSGSAIVSYSYRHARVGGDRTYWKWCRIPCSRRTAAGAVDSRTFEVEGLALDTAYTFPVRAHNAVGVGEPSNEVTVTTSKAVAALSATVDGDRLAVTYDRPLNPEAVPAASLFSTLTEGDFGPAGTIRSVSISGANVVLVLSAPVSPDDTITVTYAPPDPVTATNAITALNGKPAGPLHQFSVVNVTAPTVREIAFSTAPQAGDTYAAGELIVAMVTFNANVTVDTGAGNPRLSVEIGRAARQFSYTTGSGGPALTFEYTVSEHDVDRDGIRVLGNSLSTGGGSIRKTGTRINARLGHPAGAAQAGLKVMGPPAVSTVSLTSNPAADETYQRREVIEATVTFTSAVDVDTAGGRPFVAVVVGVDRRSLEYASGTGSDTLVFTYTVTDDDLDTDGISLPENPVATGGGAIRRAGSSDVNAFLDHPGQPDQPGHKVGGYVIIEPARVADLIATPGKHRVSLDWSAPDDGGSEITGYRIELSTDGAAWTDLQANTENTDTSYSEAYLGSTAVRHYRVSAINAIGTGPPSEPAVVAPLAATAPDPPTKLAATAVSDTTIDLLWAAPEDDGGALLSGYKVEAFYPNEETPEWIVLFADTGNTGTFYEHSGLVAGTSVRYRVSAINSVGTGLPSDVASAVTVTTPPQPTGLAARADGETVIVLTWDVPQGDLARTITGYKIELSSTGTGGWSELEADTGNRDTTYRHSGLAPGTRNHYRVYAINPAGNSRASLTADATTNTAATGQPTIAGTAEEGQTLTAGLAGIADHDGTTKADAGDAGYAYSYQWLRVASGSETAILDAVSSAYTPVKADVGHTLKVRVEFTDDAGNAERLVSSASGVVAPAPTGPEAPTGLAASSAAVETATLAWTGGGDGGSPVLRHQYRFSTDGGRTWRQDWTDIPDSAPDGSNVASYTVTAGLENLDGRADTEFTFEVRAVNAVAPGPPSNQSGATIPLDRAGIISIVRLLTSAELGYQHLIPTDRVATGRPFRVAVVFDRPASGLEPSDLIVANGTVNSVGICTPKVWCAEVQPDKSGDGETLTVDVAADSVDAGNDANTADQQFSILVDGSRTSLSITKETTADPVVGAFTVQLEFGEDVLSYVTGDLSIVFLRAYHLEAGDIRLSRGELTLARLSDSRYRATVRPPEEFNGELTISVPEDSATTIPGRGNEAADLTVNVNTVAPAQDASLRSLELSGVTFTPEFDVNVSEYVATVAKTVSRTTVTAEATAPEATVTLPGDDAVPGTEPGEIGHQVDLEVGENFLTVTVVSSDGTVSRDYYVRITRQSAPNMDSTGEPAISGTPPQVGKTLTASSGDIADRNGLSGATYSYRWYRTVSVNGQPTSTQLTDETTSTYTPVSADVGKTLMVRATFIDDDLHEETRDSAATAAVVAASANVPGAPTGLTATVGDAQVSLGWTASTAPAADPVTAYHYRYKTDGAYGEWTAIADSASLTEFTVAGLTNGAQHTFQLRAVNSTGSSEPSAELTATPSAITVQVKRIAADRSGPEALYHAPLNRAGRLPFTITGGVQRRRHRLRTRRPDTHQRRAIELDRGGPRLDLDRVGTAGPGRLQRRAHRAGGPERGRPGEPGLVHPDRDHRHDPPDAHHRHRRPAARYRDLRAHRHLRPAGGLCARQHRPRRPAIRLPGPGPADQPRRHTHQRRLRSVRHRRYRTEPRRRFLQPLRHRQHLPAGGLRGQRHPRSLSESASRVRNTRSPWSDAGGRLEVASA